MRSRSVFLVILALVLVLPASANAKTARVYDEATNETDLTGLDCEGLTAVSVKLPASAQVTHTTMGVGTPLPDYTDETTQVAKVTQVKQGVNSEGERFVTWYAQGVGDCDEGWNSADATFTAGYIVRENLRMTRSEIRRYAKKGLADKFGETFTTADSPRLRCRRTSSLSGRCRVGWFQGDTVWYGKVRVWFTVEPGEGPYESDEVHWNYALRIRQVSEYCLSVLNKPFRSCSKLIRVK